jgi:N-methylhydantoinase A/oxoprolinase/acetone carboxylase beta subunit
VQIGIDVGGTNTDAVLMDGGRVLAWHKAETTRDVTGGITDALTHLLDQWPADPADPADIEAVIIGTTHFVNAVTERRRLLEVACIRLSLPAATVIPPLADWPDELRQAVGNHVYFAHGGYNFDGRPISPLDTRELQAIAADIRRRNLRSIAISSVFAPINDKMERAAADIFATTIPGVFVSLSADIGRIGLLERENATILNASLRDVARKVTRSLRAALTKLNLNAPFFVTQNDGTLMSADYAEEHPILTFASGPTNSMRGAAFLSGAQHAVVIDVGGTSTDVGVLVNSYPREAASAIDIAGVRTSFRMPDLVSIGLGGGSLVRRGGQDGTVIIGPQSVGYELNRRGIAFGGDALTATDVVVASGAARLGDPSLVDGLDKALVGDAVSRIQAMIADVVDHVKVSTQPIPVVLVGGGAILVKDPLAGASNLTRPDHWPVANAVGAAMAQVGGEVDRVFSLETTTRDAVLAKAQRQAEQKAIAAGAKPGSVSIVDIDEVALTYMPGNATRVRVKALGELDTAAERAPRGPSRLAAVSRSDQQRPPRR